MPGPELSVSGGAGGVAARYDDLDRLAAFGESDAGALAAISSRCHAVLVDPDVMASAVLDPPGMVAFAEALLGALDGPGGLSALSARMLARSVALRAVSMSYQVVDEAERELLDAVRFGVGYAVGQDPFLVAALAGGGYAAYRLTDGTGSRIDGQRLLTEHPGLLDTMIGAAPGVLDAMPGWGPVLDVTSAARLVARCYPDGAASVADLGVDVSDESMIRAPAGYADLINGLAYRDAVSAGAHQGEVDVRVVTQPDGSHSYIVDIPGTKDRHLAPGAHPGPVTDMGTNLHAIGGEPTSYEAGVAEALRRAGAGPTDPVMLVGHSQGGIVAADAARDFVSRGQFAVTHVVTFGAPVGRIDLPDSVSMLAVENRDDIVPHLDAADNRDTANRTTVSFTNDTGNVGLNHALSTTYVPAACALDDSTDPSVVAFHDSATAFLSAGPNAPITSYAYQISRT